MCGPDVKTLCFVLLLVARYSFAGVCDNKTPLEYGLYLTPQLDFVTALSCCFEYDQVVFMPRTIDEKNFKLMKQLSLLVSNKSIWIPFHDITEEGHIMHLDATPAEFYLHMILHPTNSEENDCVFMKDIQNGVFEWVDCNAMHHVICKDLSEYRDAQL